MKDTHRFVFCLLLSASAASFFPHRIVAQDQPGQDQICEVRKVGDCGVTAPKPLYHPDPEYTDRARRKKISGMVLLSIAFAFGISALVEAIRANLWVVLRSAL
jgi:hypothetical protein